jgi:sugar phosphate isomerase/epimerase
MSIRSSVTISLVPEARGGPFVFWDDLPAGVAKARALGFDAVEVFPPGPDALKVEDVRALLDENGLALAAVGTGAGWLRHKLTLTSPERPVRLQAVAFIRAIIDFAGPLGAPAIIGSMQGRHGAEVERESALGYLTEALDDLGEHARQYGVPLLYEPLNRYETNLVNRVEQGKSLLQALSTKNAKLLADLFHMNIEETDVAAAIEQGRSAIGHVHFVDSNRRAAGLGHIDFAPIARALTSIGYDGFLSAEALPLPDPDAAAEATIKAFRHYFPNVR